MKGVRSSVLPLRHAGARLMSSYGARGAIQTVVAVANFFLVQAIGRVLDTSDFGLYSLFLVANALLAVLFVQPITEGINRFLSEAIRAGQKEEFQQTLVRSLLICLGLLLFIGIASVGVLNSLNVIPAAIMTPTLWSMVLYVVVAAITAVAITYFNAGAQFLWCFFAASFAPIGSTIAIVFFSQFEAASILSVIVYQLIGWLLTLTIVLSVRFTRVMHLMNSVRRASQPSEREFASSFVRYISSLPSLGLAYYASVFGDRYLIANFFSLQEVGQYSYLYFLTTNIVAAAYSVYATATYLRAVENLSLDQNEERRREIIRRFPWTSLTFLLIFTPLLVIYVLFDQEIVRLVFGPGASAPNGCLPLLLVAAVLNFGSQQLSIVGNIMKMQSKFIAPRWAFVAALVAGVIAYHPSLYGVCVVIVAVNVLQLFVVGLLVYRMQSNSVLRA